MESSSISIEAGIATDAENDNLVGRMEKNLNMSNLPERSASSKGAIEASGWLLCCAVF
jgi:hypothetical protein